MRMGVRAATATWCEELWGVWFSILCSLWPPAVQPLPLASFSVKCEYHQPRLHHEVLWGFNEIMNAKLYNNLGFSSVKACTTNSCLSSSTESRTWIFSWSYLSCLYSKMFWSGDVWVCICVSVSIYLCLIIAIHIQTHTSHIYVI